MVEGRSGVFDGHFLGGDAVQWSDEVGLDSGGEDMRPGSQRILVYRTVPSSRILGE